MVRGGDGGGVQPTDEGSADGVAGEGEPTAAAESAGSDNGVFGRLPERYAHAYLVAAFFVLPAMAVVLSGGGVRRPPGPVGTALLALLVVHHAAFLVASVLLD